MQGSCKQRLLATAQVLSPWSWPWEKVCSPQPPTHGWYLSCRSGGLGFLGTELKVSVWMEGVSDWTTISEVTLQGARCSWLLYWVVCTHVNDVIAPPNPPMLSTGKKMHVATFPGPLSALGLLKDVSGIPGVWRSGHMGTSPGPRSGQVISHLWTSEFLTCEFQRLDLLLISKSLWDQILFLCNSSGRKKIKVCKARIK